MVKYIAYFWSGLKSLTAMAGFIYLLVVIKQ